MAGDYQLAYQQLAASDTWQMLLRGGERYPMAMVCVDVNVLVVESNEVRKVEAEDHNKM